MTFQATQEREIEVVGREDYQAAAADPLASIAPMLVRKWNMEHLEDIVRFCSFLTGATLEEVSLNLHHVKDLLLMCKIVGSSEITLDR